MAAGWRAAHSPGVYVTLGNNLWRMGQMKIETAMAALLVVGVGLATSPRAAEAAPGRMETMRMAQTAPATTEKSGDSLKRGNPDQPKPPETQPQPTHMSESQQKNVDKLVQDLSAIKAGSQVTPEQKQQLATDLQTIATSATKPSQESVQALATTLSGAKADGSLDPAEVKDLASAVVLVLDSANISQADAQAAVASAKAILEASGVDKTTAQALVKDLQVIGEELRKNVSNVKSQSSGSRRQR